MSIVISPCCFMSIVVSLCCFMSIVISQCCFMSIVSALIWKGVYICDFVFWLWYFFFLDLMIYNVLVLMQVDEEFDRYNMIGVGMKSWELFFRWCWAWGLSLTFVDLGSEEITLFVFHLGSLPHCWGYSNVVLCFDHLDKISVSSLFDLFQ